MNPDHVTRYFDRLDKALVEMPAHKQADWLIVQRDHWETLFDEFCRRVDFGESVNVWASDYLLTIAGLDQRIAKLGKAA